MRPGLFVCLFVCLFVGCSYNLNEFCKYKLFTEQEFIGHLTWDLLDPPTKSSQLTPQEKKLQNRLSALTLSLYWGIKLHHHFQSIELERFEKRDREDPGFAKWQGGYFFLNSQDLLNADYKKALDENNLSPNQFLYWKNFLSLVQPHFKPWRNPIILWKKLLKKENISLKKDFQDKKKQKYYYPTLSRSFDSFLATLKEDSSPYDQEIMPILEALKNSSFSSFDALIEKNFSEGFYWALMSRKMEKYEGLSKVQKKRYKMELEQWQGKITALLTFFLTGRKDNSFQIQDSDLMELARLFANATLLDQYPFRRVVLGRSKNNMQSTVSRESKKLYRNDYLPLMLKAVFATLVHGESSTSLGPDRKSFYISQTEKGPHIALLSPKSLYPSTYSVQGKPCLFVSPHRIGDSLYTQNSLEFNADFGYFGIHGWRKKRIESAWPKKDGEGNVEGNFTVTTFIESEILNEIQREVKKVRRNIPALVKELVSHFGFYRLISFRAIMNIPREVQSAFGLVQDKSTGSTKGSDSPKNSKSMIKIKSSLFTDRLANLIRRNYKQTKFASNFSEWKFVYEEKSLSKAKEKLGENQVIVRFLNENPLLLANLPRGRILYWCDRYRDIWAVSSAELRQKQVLLENQFRHQLSNIFLHMEKISRGLVGPEIIWLGFPGTKAKPIVVREGLLTWLRSYSLGNPRSQTIPRELSSYEFSFNFVYEKRREEILKRFQENQYFNEGFWLILPLPEREAFEKKAGVFQAFFRAYATSLLHFNLEKLPPDLRKGMFAFSTTKAKGSKAERLMNTLLAGGGLWSKQIVKSLKFLQISLDHLGKGRGIGRAVESLLEASFLQKHFLLPSRDREDQVAFSFFFAKKNIAPFAIFSQVLPMNKKKEKGDNYLLLFPT